MTLDSSQENPDSKPDLKSGGAAPAGLCQALLAITQSTLAKIARGAPLYETLAGIVQSIEDRSPGLRAAIFLLDEAGQHLRLGAAPSLPDSYRQAVDDQAADDSARLADTEDLETGPFWQSLCAQARQHGLHACAAAPLRCAAQRLLGMLVIYSHQPGAASAAGRQAMTDAAVLAALAVEHEAAAATVKRHADVLRESERTMALALEGSGTGLWDRNILTGEINYSPGWKAIIGYQDWEITNFIKDSYTRVHPDDLAYVQATIQAHFDQKTESYAVEHRIRCKDGSYKWISSRGKVVSRDPQGQALRMIGTTTDITAMRTLSEKLQQSVDLITSLTNEVPGLVYQYRLLPSGEAFIPYASEGIRDIYELAPHQVAQSVVCIEDMIHPDDLFHYRTSLQASAAGLTPWQLEYRVVLPRQGLSWRQGHARPRRLADGSTLWHGFITDITERKRIEAELQEFATVDFLTQLPNRRCFMARMEEELSRLQRIDGTSTAVLMFDLDHFKTINDNHGHAMGDQVLKHFAGILRGELRKTDTVGRVGGEEFAVVLRGAGIAEAEIFARRLQKRLAETQPKNGAALLPLTMSIGIAAMHASDAGIDASLSRSDVALYRAKENGRDRIEIALD